MRKHTPMPGGCPKHPRFDDDCADCLHGEDHQDIARRNQESDDREAAAFYFRFYHRLSIKPEAVPDLLACLRDVLDCDGDLNSMDFERYRAAIAKAEGSNV